MWANFQLLRYALFIGHVWKLIADCFGSISIELFQTRRLCLDLRSLYIHYFFHSHINSKSSSRFFSRYELCSTGQTYQSHYRQTTSLPLHYSYFGFICGGSKLNLHLWEFFRAVHLHKRSLTRVPQSIERSLWVNICSGLSSRIVIWFGGAVWRSLSSKCLALWYDIHAVKWGNWSRMLGLYSNVASKWRSFPFEWICNSPLVGVMKSRCSLWPFTFP